MDERKSTIKIGGQEYDLVLTTGATKEIAGRYGGLANLGDKMMSAENFEMAISEIVWLITILANQGIKIHNLKHPEDKKELLTEEMVEVLTVPYELADYREAITEALNRGTARNIVSEGTNSKNAEVE
ncbi:MAG: hypothetical protein J5728_10755 [Lachnospiraceae bacterium]|nr:hypothetical protein [Lachnospiraceae bacterium]